MIMCSKTYQCNRLQKQKYIDVQFTKYMCKFTNSHSANIKLSCSLCRVNTTKSKWKSIQHFSSFCSQTLHLNDKKSLVLNLSVNVWVAPGWRQFKYKFLMSNERNSSSKIATEKNQCPPPQRWQLWDIIFENCGFNHCNKISWDNCGSVTVCCLIHVFSISIHLQIKKMHYKWAGRYTCTWYCCPKVKKKNKALNSK